MSIKRRVINLEEKYHDPETPSYRRVICEKGETPDQLCARLGLADQEYIIFRTII